MYFAAFHSWLNGANLVLLVAGLGLALAVASLPVAVPAGAAALTVHLAMTLMCGLRVAENSMRSLLYEPALDRALARAPLDAADRGRALLKAIAPRGGEGLGALLVLGLGTTAGLGLLGLLLLPSLASSEALKIDADHFQRDVQGAAPVQQRAGPFQKFEGQVEIDEMNLAASKVSTTIRPRASTRTSNRATRTCAARASSTSAAFPPSRSPAAR